MADGLIDSLRALTRDSRPWVSEGVILEAEENTAFGWLYTVRLVPLSLEVQVRALWPMGGAAEEGIFTPYAVDDAVIVGFCDGDINRGVILGGTPSTPNPIPAGWDGQSSILIKHLQTVAVEAPQVLLGSREAVQAVALAPLVEAAVAAAVAAVAAALNAGAAAAAGGDGGAIALGAAASALGSFTAASTAAGKVMAE